MAKARLVKMRELFKAEGFDFHKEFIKALNGADPDMRLEALVSVAPYFMERLRPEPEDEDAPKDVTPETSQKISKSSDAQLMKALEKSGKPRRDQD